MTAEQRAMAEGLLLFSKRVALAETKRTPDLRDDAIAEAWLAVCEAATRFAVDGPSTFQSYAYQWIINAVRTMKLRDRNPVGFRGHTTARDGVKARDRSRPGTVYGEEDGSIHTVLCRRQAAHEALDALDLVKYLTAGCNPLHAEWFIRKSIRGDKNDEIAADHGYTKQWVSNAVSPVRNVARERYVRAFMADDEGNATP